VTAGLPFVDSPTPLLLCLAGYLAVVAFGLAFVTPAPADSKRPDPAWLRFLVLVHNFFLVGLSLFMSGG
jgi:elongation of very long chain fatty acids protein 4